MVGLDRSLNNTPFRMANIYAGYLMTFGGLERKVVAITNYIGMEYFSLNDISYKMGLIKTNTIQPMYVIPGLSPSPVKWD